MTHYKVKPYKLHNDPKIQWADYYDSSSYFEDRFVMVPVDKIHFKKWNQDRYDFYMDAFKSGRAADPVRLSRPWHGGDYFEVSDGNHRTAASIDMGYTHVPAIVSVEIKNKSPDGHPPKNLYEEIYGREQLLVVEFFRAWGPSESNLYFEWGGVEDWGYWIKVSDETDSVMQPYKQKMTVVISGESRVANMQWRGKRFSYNGDLEGMKKGFLHFMESVAVKKASGRIERIVEAVLKLSPRTVSLKMDEDGDNEAINKAFDEMASKMYHLDGPFFMMNFGDDGIVTLEIKPSYDSIRLSFITTPDKYRHKGLASRAMKVITGIADKHGVKISLSVSQQGSGGLTKNSCSTGMADMDLIVFLSLCREGCQTTWREILSHRI